MKKLKIIFALAFIAILSSCSKSDDKVQNQQNFTQELNFSNGNLSTGSTSSSGVSAPTGYTWSELEPTNASPGYTGSGTSFLADDFTVPTGEKWNISKFIFFSHQTGYNGANSPFNDVKYELYATSPSVANATKIYGDFTTNKYESSEDAKMYRIGNSATSATNIARKIYKITATATNLELSAGTYWIKWQTKTITDEINYNATNTTKGFATMPNYNAQNLFNDVWSMPINGPGNKIDFPFGIMGTKTKV